jgi:hypothetical protein
MKDLMPCIHEMLMTIISKRTEEVEDLLGSTKTPVVQLDDMVGKTLQEALSRLLLVKLGCRGVDRMHLILHPSMSMIIRLKMMDMHMKNILLDQVSYPLCIQLCSFDC